MKIQLGTTDLSRTIKGGPTIPLLNRYYEKDPTSNEQVSLQSRPGLVNYMNIGPVGGPVRALFSQYGFANNSLFAVVNNEVHRIDRDGITTGLLGTLTTTAGFVSMAATEDYLFIADGAALYYSTTATGNLTAIAVPDNDGIISVGHIAGYIICVVAQGVGKNGRFYWIQPGATTINALDFATAERSPDPVWGVLVVGDQFWLPGPSTTEVWYMTGGTPPFARYPGRIFDKGTWEGTAVQIKDDVMAVGTDGVVYRIGSEPTVVSTPYITQRIREAINASREAP